MQIAATAVMPTDEPSGADREEARLVAASRRGDTDAFAELVRRHQRRVFRLAARFFDRPDQVEDAAQETFLRAWERLDTYRARAPFEHWLTRVCLNCCYAQLRKRPAPDTPLDDVQPAAPEHDPGARLETERLLAMLEPEDRFVLTLLHGEGRSVAEIAGALGWSRANVKVRAHRARRRLRRLLEEGPSA